VTCELTLRDPRSIARIINLAHRFTCRCTRVDAVSNDETTSASFAFSGNPGALARLRAQIDRIVAVEGVHPERTDLQA
jgi:hypothetical protein